MAIARVIDTVPGRYPGAYETYADLDEPCEHCGAADWEALGCHQEPENPMTTRRHPRMLDVCDVRCRQCGHETTLREGV